MGQSSNILFLVPGMLNDSENPISGNKKPKYYNYFNSYGLIETDPYYLSNVVIPMTPEVKVK